MTAPALSLRIVAALHSDAVLVARPRGMVHVHNGPLTRTGRAVPGSARPLCGTRSKRLRVVAFAGEEVPAAVAGRRFCRACTHRLPARLGAGRVNLDTREGWLEAYGDLTRTDLRLAAGWCRTEAETYQVMRVLQMLFGSAVQEPELHKLVNARRRALQNQHVTPDEIAARFAESDRALATQQRHQKARIKDAALERAQRRARAGKYVDPRDRELLNSSA